jgi:hypothetical protein
MTKKLSELNTLEYNYSSVSAANRAKEIQQDLDKLYSQTKNIPADSPEGIELAIAAFKLINELLDLK